jgi:hypothetical protein
MEMQDVWEIDGTTQNSYSKGQRNEVWKWTKFIQSAGQAFA